MSSPPIHSNFTRNFYFIIGIVATFAYRIIIVLNNYNAAWVTISWYVGTIGFILYFIHRYQISQKRSRLIREHNLIQKVGQATEFSKEDKQAMQYIVDTLASTKEKWNYIFIFVLSGLSLIAGVVLDFII